MDDNKIKDLLDKDQSVPALPRSEWLNLASRIESKPKIGFIRPLAIAFSLGIFFLTINMQSVDKSPRQVTDQELYEYVMSDDYFDSFDESYSWIDSN
tara:strand:- start:241 stop:531 length:291 start_codon:yes stop_codon:yes gene_type:complete